MKSLYQGCHVVATQGRVRGMSGGLILGFCLRWAMTLSEVRRQEKFSSDVPSTPRDPHWEAMQFYLSVLIEHPLCAGTVVGIDAKAGDKADVKRLLRACVLVRKDSA